MKKPVLLAILDGYGLAPPGPSNAIAAARTPNLDAMFARFPHTNLACSGLDVGLPAGQMGNSEVGHTIIGAGRVVYQDLTRISRAIVDGELARNPAIVTAIDKACDRGATVHLLGLLSDGGVHSHIDHLFALLDICHEKKARTRIHCILDGRDTLPRSGRAYLERLEQRLAALGGDMAIASLSGRYYAMDRDNRWKRLEKAYAAMVTGQADFCPSPVEAIEKSYAADITDEFLLPVVCAGESTIRPEDSVICFNFRPDRSRQITRALVDPDFDGFARPGGLVAPHYVCFTQYDAAMPGVEVAFAPEELKNTFGEYISALGLTQLRIAETEKYAHVTFFFDGGVEKAYPGEDRILVPSPQVATYDLQPEMSAPEVCDRCIAAIESGAYDVIILNFANCDMVGHSGIFDATVAAIEVVDDCVGRLFKAVKAAGGTMLITADHGNADKMSENNAPFTAHTTNPAPFLLSWEGARLYPGGLRDIAPTMLALLGQQKPEEMTGNSLIVNEWY